MIRKAVPSDAPAVAALYDEAHDDAERTVNYGAPSWKKGVYPTLRTAEEAIREGSLFLYEREDGIIGAFIMNSRQNSDYAQIDWGIDPADEEIFALHTLVISPRHRRGGIAEEMMRYAIALCGERGAKTIRVDTHTANVPAQKLYRKCGFQDAGHSSHRGITFVCFEYIL